jgi:hypothetical protein
MRRHLLLVPLLASCALGGPAPPETTSMSEPETLERGLKAEPADPLLAEPHTELAPAPLDTDPLDTAPLDTEPLDTEPFHSQAAEVGFDPAAMQQLAAEALVSKKVLATVKVVDSSCPGIWAVGDSYFAPAALTVEGDQITVDLYLYPPLTGTLVDDEVVLSGFLASMPEEPNTSCTVNGTGGVNGPVLTGKLTEQLSGDTNCTTTVTYSL